LDADSYATDNKPLITHDMFDHDLVSHRWGYSWVDHIEALDKWAKGHPSGLFKDIPPMRPNGCVAGRKFWHSDRKRPISYFQLTATDLTRRCVELFGPRLPAPSQDTSMWYVADRLGSSVSLRNFKKNYGFTQGR
jgi:hypothetical protein